jgi:hypothetical protein
VDEQQRYAAFVPEMLSLYPNQSVEVGTYLQSFKYWTSLPFRLPDTEWARLFLHHHNITVGVHIRRGDYLLDANHVGKTPPVEYYALALATANATMQNTLLFTDDAAWVRTEPIFQGMLVSRGRTPGQDLALLSECSILIMSVGTFGWWAHLLGSSSPKVIYYYARPHNDWHQGWLVPQDHFPPSFVGLLR